MTEITDDEAAEVLWASSEQGKAAVKAAWEKRCLLGTDLDRVDIGTIVYAAFLAAGRDAVPGELLEASEPEPAGCEHRWTILAAQETIPPGFTFGKPVPHTAVLTRCEECGQPESWLLIGAWTLEDLKGEP